MLAKIYREYKLHMKVNVNIRAVMLVISQSCLFRVGLLHYDVHVMQATSFPIREV